VEGREWPGARRAQEGTAITPNSATTVTFECGGSALSWYLSPIGTDRARSLPGASAPAPYHGRRSPARSGRADRTRGPHKFGRRSGPDRLVEDGLCQATDLTDAKRVALRRVGPKVLISPTPSRAQGTASPPRRAWSNLLAEHVLAMVIHLSILTMLCGHDGERDPGCPAPGARLAIEHRRAPAQPVLLLLERDVRPSMGGGGSLGSNGRADRSL
jgi:hypothetical protein